MVHAAAVVTACGLFSCALLAVLWDMGSVAAITAMCAEKKRFGRGPRRATILVLLAREGHTSGFPGFSKFFAREPSNETRIFRNFVFEALFLNV